ncbi:MAG: hypothetical protein ACRDYA_08145 [Egibacteraceae bacterium]
MAGDCTKRISRTEPDVDPEGGTLPSCGSTSSATGLLVDACVPFPCRGGTDAGVRLPGLGLGGCAGAGCDGPGGGISAGSGRDRGLGSGRDRDPLWSEGCGWCGSGRNRDPSRSEGCGSCGSDRHRDRDPP